MAVDGPGAGGSATGAERDPALERLYREAAAAEPPAHLDAAILAEAHRAVRAGPRAGPSFLRRWQLPLSIAAVVVLSVSLVTLVQEEGGEPLLRPEAPPIAKEPVAPPVAKEAVAPPPVPKAESASGPARPPAAAAPAPARDAARDQAPAAASKPREAAPPAASEPLPLGGMGTGAVRQPEAPPPPPTLLRREAPAAAGRPEALAEDATERAAAGQAAPAPERRSRVQTFARKEASGPGAPEAVWRDYEQEPPARWLERIAELRKLNRVHEADAMQAEFDRRFPDYRAPAASPDR